MVKNIGIICKHKVPLSPNPAKVILSLIPSFKTPCLGCHQNDGTASLGRAMLNQLEAYRNNTFAKVRDCISSVERQ